MMLSDIFKVKADVVDDQGRYGTFEQFECSYNRVISIVSGGIDSNDLADTVFVVDAWEDGCSPVDTAQEIMENDDIGCLMLEEFLTTRVDAISANHEKYPILSERIRNARSSN